VFVTVTINENAHTPIMADAVVGSPCRTEPVGLCADFFDHKSHCKWDVWMQWLDVVIQKLVVSLLHLGTTLQDGGVVSSKFFL
jgi:hypothetical protein